MRGVDEEGADGNKKDFFDDEDGVVADMEDEVVDT
jgi:hypothetical protein